MNRFDLERFINNGKSLWDVNNWDMNSLVNFKPFKSDDGRIFYRFIIPGYKKEDITIEKNNDIISISGSTNDPFIKEDKNSFNYKIASKNEIIDAEYINGVLYIFLEQEKENTKKIEVK